MAYKHTYEYHIRPVTGRCFDAADLTLLFNVGFIIQCVGAIVFSQFVWSDVPFTDDVLFGG